MIKNQFKTPMLVAALVGTACSAWGAMETDSINFTVDDVSTVSGSFPLFDSSLGTLTGVEIDFSFTTTTEALVYSRGTKTYPFSDVSVQSGTETITALINGNNFTLDATSPAIGSQNGTTTGPTTIAGIATGQPQISDETGLALSSFIGTGLVSSAAFNISAESSAAVLGTGSSALSFGSEISSEGTFDVVYTYIAVPEASQFPLISAAAAGLIGMGAMARRLRQV